MDCFFNRVLFNSLRTTEAIRTIKKLGGIAILAHPKDRTVRSVDFAEIDELITSGLDGIEIYNPSHSQDDIDQLLTFAKKRGLLMTGGSDFHGFRHDKRVGFLDIRYSWLGRLKEHL
jgi:hypothetical protein